MRCVHEVRGADGDSLCGLEERGNACIRSKGLAYSDCERFEEDGGMSTGFSVQVSEKMAAYLVEMYANQITTASMGGGGMVELGAVDNVQLIKNVATITAHLTGNNRDLAERSWKRSRWSSRRVDLRSVQERDSRPQSSVMG